MEIHVFDDKAINVEAANLVIAEMGHTPTATQEYWRKVDEDLIIRSPEKLALSVPDRAFAWSDNLFEEINKSIQRMKERDGGIITDLMFHISGHHRDKPQPPAGLLVALHAISAGVPVVICTNANEVGGHHAEAISWIFDGYVSKFRNPSMSCPFGWVEDKNWTEAVHLLVNMRNIAVGSGT